MFPHRDARWFESIRKPIEIQRRTAMAKMVTRTCSCGCCMLVVERHKDGCYNISVVDSRYDHDVKGILGRLKNAVKILFGKPVYYNDLFIEDKSEFEDLLKKLQELL